MDYVSEFIDKALRSLGRSEILRLCAPLCTVTSIHGEKYYTVKPENEKYATNIINQIEKLWNTTLLNRLPNYLKNFFAQAKVLLEKSPIFKLPYETHVQYFEDIKEGGMIDI
jgi:hypothetical protein